MTALSGKVKIALDETRMLILGSQILIGFQFRAVFEDGFEDLSQGLRDLDAVALLLMLGASVLLIAPSLYHRIAERGEDTVQLHRVTSARAGLALFPFACSIGLDIFIAFGRTLGRGMALLAGCGFATLALLCWYGIEYLRSRTIGRKERIMAAQRRDDGKSTSLHNRIEQMLTEARVILPGAQALLGFQLAIIVTRSFDALDASSKLLHATSLALVTLTVILLMAPAAYHRIVYAGEDAEEFHRTGSIMVTAATVPLAVGLGCDVYVVMARIFAAPMVAAGIAFAVTAVFVAVCHIYPLVMRLRDDRAPQTRPRSVA
jgi:Family of unknown function (DUF6328)